MQINKSDILYQQNDNDPYVNILGRQEKLDKIQ